jgi:hypothetical protein
MFSAANRRLFLTAKDRIARRIITGPKAANYEAEFSQSGPEAVIGSLQKFIQKAAAISDIISE